MSARSVTRLARRAAVVVATGALAAAPLVLAPPATAAGEHQKDPTGDTTAIELRAGAGTKPVDITRIATRYQGNTIAVTLDVADLAPVDPDNGINYTWIARLKTAAGNYLVAYGRVQDDTQSILTNADADTPPVDPGCAEPRVSYDRKHDRIILAVTRACVGATDSVRSGGYTEASQGTGTTGHTDIARRKGGILTGYEDIKLGPAVRRN